MGLHHRQHLSQPQRKIIKSRGHFLNDKAATKPLYLVSRNISKEWTMPPRERKIAMNQFAILFKEWLFVPGRN